MRLIVLPIEEEDMEALIKANNDNLLDSFKGFLEQTVSQIKQSNEESVESQTKEIKRHTFNESHKFKKKKTRTSSSLTGSLARRLRAPNPPPKIPSSRRSKPA